MTTNTKQETYRWTVGLVLFTVLVVALLSFVIVATLGQDFDQMNSAAATLTEQRAVLLWLVALYDTFVLLPWLVTGLFLWRKRSKVAAAIVDDLDRLDPGGELLQRLTSDSELLATEPSASASSTAVRDTDAKKRREIACAYLEAHKFHERDYAWATFGLSLLVLVLFFGTFFLPAARIAGPDLADMFLAEKGPLRYLMLGLLGGYLFLIYMLIGRYLSGDLFPGTLLQALERLVVVFVLAVVITFIGWAIPKENPAQDVAVLSQLVLGLVAFFAAIWPWEAIAFFGYVLRTWKIPMFSGLIEQNPVTRLDGIDVWTEARLRESQVTSVQGMATTSLAQLVTDTSFSLDQIVNWVDQAILYQHAGWNGAWYPRFRNAGIDGATQLLFIAGPDLLRLTWREDNVDLDKVQRVANLLATPAVLFAASAAEPAKGNSAFVASFLSASRMSDLAAHAHDASQRLRQATHVNGDTTSGAMALSKAAKDIGEETLKALEAMELHKDGIEKKLDDAVYLDTQREILDSMLTTIAISIQDAKARCIEMSQLPDLPADPSEEYLLARVRDITAKADKLCETCATVRCDAIAVYYTISMPISSEQIRAMCEGIRLEPNFPYIANYIARQRKGQNDRTAQSANGANVDEPKIPSEATRHQAMEQVLHCVPTLDNGCG